MIQKIKLTFISLLMALGMSAPAFIPAVAHAASSTDNNITNGLCTGANSAAGNGGSECTASGTEGNQNLKTLAGKVVNLISLVVGIVAIIMIIYGGFRYITSGGDSGRVGNAKNTLIYAIIGLIIVALSQFIVHYVLTAAETSVSTT